MTLPIYFPISKAFTRAPAKERWKEIVTRSVKGSSTNDVSDWGRGRNVIVGQKFKKICMERWRNVSRGGGGGGRGVESPILADVICEWRLCIKFLLQTITTNTSIFRIGWWVDVDECKKQPDLPHVAVTDSAHYFTTPLSNTTSSRPIIFSDALQDAWLRPYPKTLKWATWKREKSKKKFR